MQFTVHGKVDGEVAKYDVSIGDKKTAVSTPMVSPKETIEEAIERILADPPSNQHAEPPAEPEVKRIDIPPK